MSIDATRRLTMGLTAVVLLAGGLYGLLGPFGTAARLPVGGAIQPASPSHQALLIGLLVWGMTVLAAGVFVFVGLISSDASNRRETAAIRPMMLTLQWAALVMAAIPAALMSALAPIEWMRPLFYAPLVMMLGTLAVAFVRSWRGDRAAGKENDS